MLDEYLVRLYEGLIDRHAGQLLGEADIPRLSSMLHVNWIRLRREFAPHQLTLDLLREHPDAIYLTRRGRRVVEALTHPAIGRGAQGDAVERTIGSLPSPHWEISSSQGS